MTTLLWLRDDLRLADNPALAAAIAAREPLAILYLLDDESLRPIGAAARWWLHRSLQSLAADLARRGQTLILRRGRASRVVPQVAAEIGASRAIWNRRYGLAAAVWTRDITKAHRIARALRAGMVYVNCYDADDITVPFGGFKQSGTGRDKSLHAFDKYTELKTTWVDLSQ